MCDSTLFHIRRMPNISLEKHPLLWYNGGKGGALFKVKKIDFKNIPLSILIIVGILSSAISFTYYFALKNPFKIIFWLICIIDFLLFTLNAYRVIEPFDLTKSKTIIFTIVTMIGFFVFCEVVTFLFTNGTRFEYNIELFFDVLKFSLFLSPSFILLLPVMMFIAEIASWMDTFSLV